MKLLSTFVLLFICSSSLASVSVLNVTLEALTLLKEIATSDLAKEWESKLANGFLAIASASEAISAFTGNASEIIAFALTLLGANQDHSTEYLKNITTHLDKIEAKIDDLSDQISQLNNKITQSTIKIITEIKLRDFINNVESIAAFKKDFESIVFSFISNPKLLIDQLDKIIDDYHLKNADVKLIDTLDNGSGFSASIVDDLIALSRSYHKSNFGSSGSSTMKIVYDLYITALMAVLKGNFILESAVNMKTLVTGHHYDESRRYNHHRKNDMLITFFKSLERTFKKFKADDIDGFVDLNTDDDDESKNVRLMNVFQYFWEKEEELSDQNSCKLTCEDYTNVQHKKNGCNGLAKNCKHVASSVKLLRQNPQKDRIYQGYAIDDQVFGKDVRNEMNTETLSSYFNIIDTCDICFCICDQFEMHHTVRRIYIGKISAPDGYVVTGIRIVIENDAIYPQLQIGKLLPMMLVDPNSVHWGNLPYDDVLFTLEFDKKSIEFGDQSVIKFPNGVVTGVQFKTSLSGVLWTIYGRDIVNFNEGILGDEIYIRTSDTEVILDAYNLIPGLSTGHDFNIKRNAKIEFGISNETSDAGQSFVPYFDGTEITFDIKSPLSGIALIHYANDDKYAGYIRPVITSIDYTKYVGTVYQAVDYVPANFTAIFQKLGANGGFKVTPKNLIVFIMFLVLKNAL